jgi:hypothetical protein
MSRRAYRIRWSQKECFDSRLWCLTKGGERSEVETASTQAATSSRASGATETPQGRQGRTGLSKPDSTMHASFGLIAWRILARAKLLDEVVGGGESWHQPKGPKTKQTAQPRQTRRLGLFSVGPFLPTLVRPSSLPPSLLSSFSPSSLLYSSTVASHPISSDPPPFPSSSSLPSSWSLRK